LGNSRDKCLINIFDSLDELHFPAEAVVEIFSNAEKLSLMRATSFVLSDAAGAFLTTTFKRFGTVDISA